MMPKHISWDHSITRLENSHHFRANSAVQSGPFMNAYRVVRSSRPAGLFSFNLLDGLQVRRRHFPSKGSLFGYALMRRVNGIKPCNYTFANLDCSKRDSPRQLWIPNGPQSRRAATHIADKPYGATGMDRPYGRCLLPTMYECKTYPDSSHDPRTGQH